MVDETPDILRIQERNAFYESLSPAAKEQFLAALEAAQTRGLEEEVAWREAVRAAETAYANEPALPDEDLAPGNI